MRINDFIIYIIIITTLKRKRFLTTNFIYSHACIHFLNCRRRRRRHHYQRKETMNSGCIVVTFQAV